MIGTKKIPKQQIADYISGTTQTALNAKQGTLTLTTTGTSGAATLISNTLNIPQYSGGGSSAWIDYSATSTIVGWSSFTNKYLSYKIIDNYCFVSFNFDGASNSTLITFTMPFNNTETVTVWGNCGYAANGGSGVTNVPRVGISANSNMISASLTFAGGAWAASASKALAGFISFKIN